VHQAGDQTKVFSVGREKKSGTFDTDFFLLLSWLECIGFDLAV
jgi:hypothetical protein